MILGKSDKIIIPNNFHQNYIASASKYFTRVLKEKYCFKAVKSDNLKYFIIFWEKSYDNNYIFRIACQYGCLEIVKYLHQNNGIHVNDELVLACENGQLEIIKYLHQNGANIYFNNNIAVQRASKYGHLEVVKYLHQNGADISDDKDLALEWACQEGHLEVVKYLHQNGTNICSINEYIIELASLNNHPKIVKYLINKISDMKKI